MPATGDGSGEANAPVQAADLPHSHQQAPRTTTSKRRLQRRATPLQLIQYPFLATGRAVFDLRRFLIVITLTVGVLLLPRPEGLSEQGQRALALFAFTGSILALEPAPLPISALLVPVAQVALGIDTATGAFRAFAQPSVFLVLSSLFLAEALRKHGLTRRMAIYAIVTSGGKLPRLLFNLMLLTGLLSMWVMNTATTAVLIPVALTVAQHVPQPQHAKRMVATLVIGIAYASSVGGIATVVGSGENAIAAGYLNGVRPFGFFDWMKYGFPIVCLLLPLTWWLIMRLMNLPELRIDTRPALRDMVRSGPLTSTERKILVVISVCVVLWIAGGAIEDRLNLPNTLLSSAIVSIGAVAFLSFSEIIDWNDMKGVNWGVFLVIGAGFTLGDALEKSGANAWFAAMVAPTLSGLPFAIVLFVVVMFAFVVTQFMNDVTLGAILTPVLVAMGLASGLDPQRLVIPTIVTVGIAYMLPSASARMTLVAVSGTVPRNEMMRVGFLIGLPSALLVFLFFYLLSVAGLI